MNIKKIIGIICALALIAVAVILLPEAGLIDRDAAATGTIEERKAAAEKFVREGRLKKAENTYKSVLEEEPGDSEARDALIDVYVNSGEYSEAAKEMERIARSQPESRETLDPVYDLYRKGGDSLGALSLIEGIADEGLRREYIDAALDRNSEKALPMGNTMGNLSSGGAFAFKDNMVFYCDPSKGESLFRYENGTSEMICNGRIESLNVVGDYLYFVDKRDYGIYKIGTDGNNYAKVGENMMATDLTIIGNKMYFVNWMDDCKIYSMDIDGTNLTKISDKSTDMLYGHGSSLYILDRDDLEAFYRIPLDGSGEQYITNASVYFVTGYDNNIYFRAEQTAMTEDFFGTEPSEGGNLAIYRMTTDGMVYEQINNSRSGYINADKGEVFFVDFENAGSIVKMNEDGSNQTVICSDGANSLSIDGDYLYYFSDHNDKKAYRIRKDGTGKECLN